MSLYNNIPAMSILNESNRNNNRLGKALKKVSSGMKINSAGDDASAYSISEKMRAQIRSLDQDTQNTRTGRSLIAVAEGGIQDIVENLRYLKEKAINAANDHNTDADRAFIQKEVNAHIKVINDIASTTSYNGRILLNGDYKQNINHGAVVTGSSITTVGSGANVTVNTLTNLWDGMTPISNAYYTGTLSPVTKNMMYKNTPADYTYYDPSDSRIRLNFDFSKAVDSARGVLAYPDSFDKQGFAIGCTKCNAYSSILFDKSISSADSYVTLTRNQSQDNLANCSYNYVIGIMDVTDETSMRDAVFNGIWAANDKVNVMLPVNIANQTKYDAAFNKGTMGTNYAFLGSGIGAHNLAVCRNNVTGEYYIERYVGADVDRDPVMSVYVKGAITQGDTYPPNASLDGIQDLSLIIHTGPQSSQNLKIFINDMHAAAMGIEPLEVGTREAATQAIDRVDNAISYALDENTRMGAYYMRLEETDANLVLASENNSAAESAIRDADMAKSMMDYTKNSILAQANNSMLAQANQSSHNVLQLLQ